MDAALLLFGCCIETPFPAIMAVDAPCLPPITIFLFNGGRLSFFSSSTILSMKPFGGGTGTNRLNGLAPAGFTAVLDYCVDYY